MFSPNFKFIIIVGALLVQCSADEFTEVETSEKSSHFESESQVFQNSNVDISSSFSKSESTFETSETEIVQNESSFTNEKSTQDSDYFSSNISTNESSSFSQFESSISSSSTSVTDDLDSNGPFSNSDKLKLGSLPEEDLLQSSDSSFGARSLDSLPAFPENLVRPKPLELGPKFSNSVPKNPPGRLTSPGSYSRAGSFNAPKSTSPVIDNSQNVIPSDILSNEKQQPDLTNVSNFGPNSPLDTLSPSTSFGNDIKSGDTLDTSIGLPYNSNSDAHIENIFNDDSNINIEEVIDNELDSPVNDVFNDLNSPIDDILKEQTSNSETTIHQETETVNVVSGNEITQSYQSDFPLELTDSYSLEGNVSGELVSDFSEYQPSVDDFLQDQPTFSNPTDLNQPSDYHSNYPFDSPVDFNQPPSLHLPTFANSELQSIPHTSLSEDLPLETLQPYNNLDNLTADFPSNTEHYTSYDEDLPANDIIESLNVNRDGFISPEEILESNSASSRPFFSPSISDQQYEHPEISDLPLFSHSQYDVPRNFQSKPFVPHGKFSGKPVSADLLLNNPGLDNPFLLKSPSPFSSYPNFDLPPHLRNPGYSRYSSSPFYPEQFNNELFLKELLDSSQHKSQPFRPPYSPFLDLSYNGVNSQYLPLNLPTTKSALHQTPYHSNDFTSSPLTRGSLELSPLKPTISSSTFTPEYQQPFIAIGKPVLSNPPPNFGRPSDLNLLFNQPSLNTPLYQPDITPLSIFKPSNNGYSKFPEFSRRPRYQPRNWSSLNSPSPPLPNLSLPSSQSPLGTPEDLLGFPTNDLPLSSSPYESSLESTPLSPSFNLQPHVPLTSDSPVSTQLCDSPYLYSPELLPAYSAPTFDSSLLPNAPLSYDSSPFNLPISPQSLTPSNNLSDLPSLHTDVSSPDICDSVFDILKLQHEKTVTEYLSSNSIYPEDISSILDIASNDELTFNFVIFGSSPAALMSLKTLSNLGLRILLVEKGQFPPHISKSLYFRSKILQSNYVRPIKSFAPHCDIEKTVYIPNVLGEETVYDSNIWDYGLKTKYVKWGKLCYKWTWSKIVRYFSDTVDRQSSCPVLPVAYDIEETKATSVVTKIFNDEDLHRTHYVKGKRSEGLTVMPFLQENGQNVIFPQKIFEELAGRDNIKLALGTEAENIVFDYTGKAIGLNVRTPTGAIRTINILNELIIGSNPVDTVRFLYQSGIGDFETLSQLGIPLQINLPYVGKEFLISPLYYGLLYQFPKGTLLKELESDIAGMDYLFGKYELPSSMAIDYLKAALKIYNAHESNVILNFHAFSKSTVERLKNYIELIQHIDENIRSYLLGLVEQHDILLVVPQLTTVLSRGEIFMDNSTGEFVPVIDTGMFRSNRDMAIMQKTLKVLKMIAEKETFKSLNGKVVQIPIKQCGEPDFSTEYNKCSIRYLSIPNFHYSGATIMGVDPLTSVVNEDLLVHGTLNVRIFSCGVVPYGTSADSSAISGLVGTYGAQNIVQKYQL